MALPSIRATGSYACHLGARNQSNLRAHSFTLLTGPSINLLDFLSFFLYINLFFISV